MRLSRELPLVAAGVLLGILAGRYRLVRRDLEPASWGLGSDALMATNMLDRVRREGQHAEVERERKRARRGE